MSDFFIRLAERTLGLALTIQPIKPSLFSRELDMSGEGLLEIPEESIVTQSFSDGEVSVPSFDSGNISVQVQHTLLSEPAQVEQLHSDAIPIHHVISSSIPAEEPIHSPLLQDSQHQSAQTNRHYTQTKPNALHTADLISTTDTIEATEQQSISHSQGTVRKQFPTMRGSSSTPGQEVISVHSQLPMISPNHPRSREEASHSRHTERGHGNTISDMHTEPAGMPQTSLREQTISRHVLLREGNARTAQMPVRHSQALPGASTVEPTIQVTIGRVEVRAVTAPATTAHQQQQSARPAAMSLDEYLRRQEQGGRR